MPGGDLKGPCDGREIVAHGLRQLRLADLFRRGEG
jgi:hypothetical protein